MVGPFWGDVPVLAFRVATGAVVMAVGKSRPTRN